MDTDNIPQDKQKTQAPPPFAENQRAEILRLLREARARGEGVRRSDLIFQYRFTQCGSRIFELEKQGFTIKRQQDPGERYITYVLTGEPEQLKPLPDYQPKQRKLASCFTERVKTDSDGVPIPAGVLEYGPLFGTGAQA